MPRTAAGGRLAALWSFSERVRVLHLTWLAFFLTFVVWFNFAPFASTIGRQLDLDRTQLTTLALCNVALTVPARVLIGMAPKNLPGFHRVEQAADQALGP